ncbi:uncharacterized protein MCYG_03908 [Microsporum canis CBS 113480]|uniref:Uncharacterized protein n=1 Tax=Arthroderma otae (strain ATCC MYA-4605 / CBS 113480) TaxID=554155 RepID=C5FMI6_ARTOC|nr:uncharacterized protein MCYG_03908 [Microsporum canis CBS 113480]EEQ31089.1 predicted protein [Microsporum canis CBS 113480]
MNLPRLKPESNLRHAARYRERRRCFFTCRLFCKVFCHLLCNTFVGQKKEGQKVPALVRRTCLRPFIAQQRKRAEVHPCLAAPGRSSSVAERQDSKEQVGTGIISIEDEIFTLPFQRWHWQEEEIPRGGRPTI